MQNIFDLFTKCFVAMLILLVLVSCNADTNSINHEDPMITNDETLNITSAASESNNSIEKNQDSPEPELKPIVKVDEQPEYSIESGLLIGLRSDYHTAPIYGPSTYRTVWVGQSEGEWESLFFERIILTPNDEEGNLWFIQPVLYNTPTDTIQYLISHPVNDKAASKIIIDDSSQNVTLFERLSYVGENVLTLQVDGEYWSGNAPAYSITVWTKRFDQLAPTNWYEKFRGTFDDNHSVSIQDMYDDTLDQFLEEAAKDMESEVGFKLRKPLGDHWGIVRQDHKWVAEVVGNFKYPYPDYESRILPKNLPESIQIIHPTFNWKTIIQVEPSATDAFVSPNQDAILIQTPDHLLLYPYAESVPQGRPVWKLELNENETIIMNKWFTGEQREKAYEQLESVHRTKNFRYPGYKDKPNYIPVH